MKLYLILGLSAFAAVCAYAQQGGQAEVALQGYYLGGGSQSLLATTGVAVKFEEFLPEFGLLRGNLEAYRTGGSIRPADNFLELRGFRAGGLRWSLTEGDFRAPASPVQNPFTNLFFPEINARGAQIEASDSRSAYSFFFGQETLLGGPRIPFRVTVPQTVMGASVRQKFGRLETGVRLLHLTTKEQDLVSGNSFLFPVGRNFLSADNLTVYTAYIFSEHFRWYGEVTAARATTIGDQAAGQPISYFFGPAWESPRFTVRANYADLGRSYFPVAGFGVGDRRGPFGEVRFRPLRRMEVFGSASWYETKEKGDPVIPYIRSTGTAAGVSVELPWRFTASAQLSTIQFSSFDPQSGTAQDSRNRQLTGTLSRPLGRQTLRLTAREMRLMVLGLPNRETSAEAEDSFQLHRFVFSGAVRGQQSLATERRNSIYLRGSAQLNLGRLTAYGYFEGGKDLVNQTVFATNTTSSSALAASLRLTRQWSIQGEAYRSRLIASLNPESVFVEGNQGVFVSPVVSQFSQWSFLFRIVHSFHWGSALPAGALDQRDFDQFMRQRIPLVGSVEGFVYVLTAGGPRPARDVVVALESGQSATTSSDGRYRFESVPEGLHTVSINLEELPADYNPGAKTKSPVSVSPGRISRVDLDLYSLSAFVGNVVVSSGPALDSLEGIVIRLEPGGRYTTTLNEGSFAFYDLPDGDYQVSLAENTLPPRAILKSPANATLAIRTGSVPAAVQFEIERRPVEEKPVRKVLEQRIEIGNPLPREDRHAIPAGTESTDPIPQSAPEPRERAPREKSPPPPAPAAIKSSPMNAKAVAAHNTRGRELLNQGKYREAIQELSAALRQQPDFTLALNARGFAYYLLRDYKSALTDFDEAIRLNPKYLNAYQNRSKARKAAGDAVGSASDEYKSRESLQFSVAAAQGHRL